MLMTRTQQLFEQHWREFVEAYPFIADHASYFQVPEYDEPQLAFDGRVLYMWAYWMMKKGYGDTAIPRELIHTIEQAAGQGG
jgi:hypothetical protein